MPPRKRTKKPAPLKFNHNVLSHPKLGLLEAEERAMRFVAELELQILEFSDWVFAARQFGKQTVAQCLGDRMVPKTPKRRRNAPGKGPTMTRYLEVKKEDVISHVPSPHLMTVVPVEQNIRRPSKRSAKVAVKQEPEKKRSRSSDADPADPVKRSIVQDEAADGEDEDMFDERHDRSPKAKKERFAKTSTPLTAFMSPAVRPTPGSTRNRTAPTISSATVADSVTKPPRSGAKSVHKLFSAGKGEPKSGERMANGRTPMTLSKSVFSASRHGPIAVTQQQQRVQNEKAAMIRRVEAQQQRQEEALARKNEMNHNKIELLKKKREERERRAAEKREETTRKELERLKRADEKKRALEQLQKAEAAAVSAQRPPLPYPPRSPMPVRSRPVKQQIPPPPTTSEIIKREVPPRSPMATRMRSRSRVRTVVATLTSPTKPVASPDSARVAAHHATAVAQATEQMAERVVQAAGSKSTVVRASSRSKIAPSSPAKSPVKPISVEQKMPLVVDAGAKKTVVAEIVKVKSSLPKTTVARLLNESVASSSANVSQSYDMTPLRTIQPSTNTDYGIDDLNSGDETDDEEAPRKRIPSWAQGANLKAAVIQQHYNCPDSRLLTCGMEAPDLSAIFAIRRARFDKRTSSALWDSPLWNPTKAANYPRVPRPASVPPPPKGKDGGQPQSES